MILFVSDWFAQIKTPPKLRFGKPIRLSRMENAYGLRNEHHPQESGRCDFNGEIANPETCHEYACIDRSSFIFIANRPR